MASNYFIILCYLILAYSTTCHRKLFVESIYNRPGTTAESILREIGFVAESHKIATSDGYLLEITRGRNRLFVDENAARGKRPQKEPILFLHGSGASATIWLAQVTSDSRPKDLTQFDLEETSIEKLQEVLADEPTKNCFPLLALNFGYEVWLLVRRGKLESLERTQSDRSYAEPKDNEIEEVIATANSKATSLISNLNLTQSARGYFESIEPILNLPFALLGNGHLAKLKAVSRDKHFWNYSHDEQISRDLPETIDYIQKVTQSKKKVVLVGHSMGSVVALLALAEQPALSEKGKCH